LDFDGALAGWYLGDRKRTVSRGLLGACAADVDAGVSDWVARARIEDGAD
jgi:hypothetical protein